MSNLSNYVGPCADYYRDNETESLTFDPWTFILSILFYDKYYLQSVRLKEVPHILKLVGERGFLELLKANQLSFFVPLHAMGYPSQHRRMGVQGQLLEVTTPFSFDICLYEIDLKTKGPDGRSFLSRILMNVRSQGMKGKQFERLKREIVPHLEMSDRDLAEKGRKHMLEDIRNRQSLLELSCSEALSKEAGILIHPDDLDVKVRWEGDHTLRIDSNILDYTKRNLGDTHRIHGQALMAMSKLTQQLVHMQQLSALTGFADPDVNLVRTRFDMLIGYVAKDPYIKECMRVLEITDFPMLSVPPDHLKIDVPMLLKLKDQDEFRAFRDWLRGSVDLDEKQIKDLFGSIKSRILNTLENSVAGRSLRFLAPIVGGFVVPGIDIALSALDTFLLNRVLKPSGIVSFVNNKLPSIFTETKEEWPTVNLSNGNR